MAILGHIEEDEGAGDRREPRRKLKLEARGALPSGASTEIFVHDISVTGLLLETEVPLHVDERISIDLPHAGATSARVVWMSGKYFGCQFHSPITPAALSAAELRSTVQGPADPAQRTAGRGDPSFGARLQRLRKAQALSQAQIAARLGVSKPTVWAWEHDKARPVDGRIADLAEVLGVTPEELLHDATARPRDDTIWRSREQIAAAFGTSPEAVKIWVEL